MRCTADRRPGPAAAQHLDPASVPRLCGRAGGGECVPATQSTRAAGRDRTFELLGTRSGSGHAPTSAYLAAPMGCGPRPDTRPSSNPAADYCWVAGHSPSTRRTGVDGGRPPPRSPGDDGEATSTPRTVPGLTSPGTVAQSSATETVIRLDTCDGSCQSPDFARRIQPSIARSNSSSMPSRPLMHRIAIFAVHRRLSAASW